MVLVDAWIATLFCRRTIFVLKVPEDYPRRFRAVSVAASADHADSMTQTGPWVRRRAMDESRQRNCSPPQKK
jgi:hypothetical protein